MKKLTPTELYTKEDWKYDVSNGDTKLGYDDWVKHNVESHQPVKKSKPTDNAKKRYVVSLEITMDDDISQTQFGNLDMGCLDAEQLDGHIDSWDFRDVESCRNVREDGTVDEST